LIHVVNQLVLGYSYNPALFVDGLFVTVFMLYYAFG